ncbi:hypothetical protein DA717_14605 [Piscirickettsiaceae bacterium NZ-RLO2]|nr:hypothetical protein DA717_14605 [Piscirickettsiaceae bacterium NZ-RLO2]
MINLGYKPHDIIRLANHAGGSINLQAAIDHHKTLTRDDFGYQIHDIVRLVAHSGGSVNLQAVVAHHQTVSKLGYSRHDIIRLASHEGGSINLQTLIKHFQELVAYGINPANIRSIGSSYSGGARLKALINYYPFFSNLENTDLLIRILKSRTAAYNIEKFLVSALLLLLLNQGNNASNGTCKIVIDSSLLSIKSCVTFIEIINKYQFKDHPLGFNEATSIVECDIAYEQCLALLTPWEDKNKTPTEALGLLL